MRLPSLPRHQAALAAVLAAAAVVASAPCAAQLRVEAIPDSVLRPYSVRESAIPAAAPPTRALPIPATDSGLHLRDYSWLGGAVQMESARKSYDGTYTRPKVIVGLPSESMKNWMNAAGLDAQQCLLPMVRARARISAEGEASAAFWLYARCTFQ